MLKQAKEATFEQCQESLNQTVCVISSRAQVLQLRKRHCCALSADVRMLASWLGVARLMAPLTEGEQPTNSETTTMDVVPPSPACVT